MFDYYCCYYHSYHCCHNEMININNNIICDNLRPPAKHFSQGLRCHPEDLREEVQGGQNLLAKGFLRCENHNAIETAMLRKWGGQMGLIWDWCGVSMGLTWDWYVFFFMGFSCIKPRINWWYKWWLNGSLMEHNGTLLTVWQSDV